MSANVRYITDERGERIGVLLDLGEYQKLVSREEDKDMLAGLSQAELHALAQGMLAPAAQNRLDELLARNAESSLSAEEGSELEQLLNQIDQLTILKARARYTLAHQGAAITAM